MNRDRVSQSALKYFLLVVVVLTGTFGAFVFGDRPAHGRDVVAADDQSSTRSPSQIDERSRPFVIDVRCWDDLATVEVPLGKHYVRLVGKMCKGAAGIEALSVSNATNEFVATIFPVGETLTTDLVPLREGSNDLLIQVLKNRQATTAHLAIAR